MFNFFRNKLAPNPSQEEKKPKEEKKSEPEMITFNQNDDCFTRARKLIKMTGLVDRHGLANHMAEGVQIYINLDKQALESRTDK